MNVTVFFQGICTHVRSDDGSVVRVVLADGRFGLALGEGGQIPPHEAVLQIEPRFTPDAPPVPAGLTIQPTADSRVWTMQGVELEILPSGSRPQGLIFEPNYGHLPSLSKVLELNEIKVPLELSRRVVHDGAAPCVFVIGDGTLDALRHKEALHGKLTVESDIPARLRIIRMWDRTETIIHLHPSETGEDPVIVVANTGVDDDKNIDFALHYGVTTFMPVNPLQLPPITARSATPEELQMLDLSARPDVPMTSTYGCSNSNYP